MLPETRGRHKPINNDALWTTSMAYLVSVSYRGDRSSAMRTQLSQSRPSGCISSRSSSLAEIAARSEALLAKWPWNERAPLPSLEMAMEWKRSRAAGRRVVERSTKGGYMVSVGYALEATKLAFKSSSRR